jgi:DNA invertase Pin-like site-specific DNA recombinase
MNITAHPAAYLRRSYVDPQSPGDISREAQRATVRKLAAADGHNGDLIEYDDWGVSADVAKSAKRTAYTQLLADMEAGSVTAVYAFDVDRLYRDPRDLIRLQDAAQRHRVRVVTTSGELPIGDGADPTAEAFAFIGAVFGGTELKKAKKRARAARDARQARGDRFGRAPFGYRLGRDAGGRVTFVPDPSRPIDVVLDAFNEAGSFAGAAWLLNQRGVPSPRGAKWAGNTINRIIRRERPGMVPRGRTEARVAARGSHAFSRLLRCPCGQLMTPRVNYTVSKYGSYGPYVGYQCFQGRHNPGHPRPYMVNEPAILEWAKGEAARLQTPERVQLAARNTDRRAELEGQRERLGWAVADGLLGREQAKERAAVIARELEQLDEQEALVDVPAVDWSWPAAELNAVLRALWEFVELDEQMRPVRAIWRVPEWRS